MDTETSHKRQICTTQPWQFLNLKGDVFQSQSNRRLSLDPCKEVLADNSQGAI